MAQPFLAVRGPKGKEPYSLEVEKIEAPCGCQWEVATVESAVGMVGRKIVLMTHKFFYIDSNIKSKRRNPRAQPGMAWPQRQEPLLGADGEDFSVANLDLYC